MKKTIPFPRVRQAVTMTREHQAYGQLLQTELADQAGRWVVIVRDRLLGAFDTYNEAMVAGYQACGFKPFLLKRVPTYSPVEQAAA